LNRWAGGREETRLPADAPELVRSRTAKKSQGNLRTRQGGREIWNRKPSLRQGGGRTFATLLITQKKAKGRGKEETKGKKTWCAAAGKEYATPLREAPCPDEAQRYSQGGK